MKTKAELWPAHGWTCDECGQDNFCRGIRIDESHPAYEELRAEIKEQLGEDEPEGMWMSRPESVTCAHCGEVFEVLDNDDGFAW